MQILREVAKYFIYKIKNFEILVSADSELLLMKKNRKGKHYLIISEKKDNMYYGFSGTTPGEFYSIKHTEGEMTISSLVKLFLTQ